MVTYKLDKLKRALHERSHLTLEFPQSGDRVIRTFIPFLENPIISEKGKANLNTYNLVGRAGQLFSYAGAESRKLSLTFHISLPHLMQMDTEEGITDKFKRQFNLFFTSKETAKDNFNLKKRPITPNVRNKVTGQLRFPGYPETGPNPAPANPASKYDFPIKDTGGLGKNHAEIHRNYYRQAADVITRAAAPPEEIFSDRPITPNVPNKETGVLRFPGYPPTQTNGAPLNANQKILKKYNPDADYSAVNKYINMVIVWLNLIRGTVLNRSDNTTYGPPIVRLTHGTSYVNVPCLVENYGVTVLEEAGYEFQTLTPKRFQITMELVESRTGDFGDYVPGEVLSGDNLTGWESIISNNDIDPYNGLIGRDGDDYGVL